MPFIGAGDGRTWGGLIACVVGGRGGVSCIAEWTVVGHNGDLLIQGSSETGHRAMGD
eukprot:COSAG01_NODE_7568_length_3145_cov_1.580762_1_plen_57_part_00